MHAQPDTINNSCKNFVVTVLLCFFLGCLGAHRFYVGKTGTAFLMLITFGGLGFWTLIDFITLITCNFEDADGFAIVPRRMF